MILSTADLAESLEQLASGGSRGDSEDELTRIVELQS